jgi:hypothetical protein
MIAPPPRDAPLPDRVLLIMVSVAPFKIPPPQSFKLPDRVKVPLLMTPPP